ncbi:MAG: 2-oxo-4-hydroxy-4-carboxy-5-ureidoimidazoline decarboxylase [Cytophagales bacterium]|nr:2-oxo-4-hydroxy-4-carboxy-5-ureidoimidazoline decarboxylase [Cytophagales bacterium]
MTLEELNELDAEAAVIELTKCCGAQSWVDRMVLARPFADEDEILSVAKKIWHECREVDWLEAFTHHPKIGAVESLSTKFANTKEWAGNEQKSVDTAPTEVIEKLANLNSLYKDKFGFIFIVYATGKSAAEMLEILESRMKNTYQDELNIAAEEQHKITMIRLKKLIA